MEQDKSLINFDDPKSISDFLNMPMDKIAAALTGILSVDALQLRFSAGKIVQAAFKGKFLNQLGKELKEYINKGQIKADYLSDSIGRAAISELLKFIDEENPDEERFKAMKALFFVSVSENVSEMDKTIAYELLKISRRISSGEILILKAAYEIASGRARQSLGAVNRKMTGAPGWLDYISKQIGHNIPSLVEFYEQNLVDLKLITERVHSDRSGYLPTDNFRLTKLGVKLCEFLSKES